MRPLSPRTLLGTIASAIVFWAMPASAQETRYSRHARPVDSPQNYALELRFGPYVPKIDDSFPTTRPYDTVFGDDKRLYIGLEFDWQILRIPMFGTVGAGLGWGYTHMTALARLHDTPTVQSAQTTTLTLMPTYGVAVLRVDVLARQTVVPLVPYAKAGLGYGFWWIGGDLGVQGKGGTWGTHEALGLMLMLDHFDEHSSLMLDSDVGVNHSYVFFEWMRANLNGLGSSENTLRMGTSTWVTGLALEM